VARLLAERGRKDNAHAQRALTYTRILRWADAHHEEMGACPRASFGKVRHLRGETWERLDNALRRGLRGLPGEREHPHQQAQRPQATVRHVVVLQQPLQGQAEEPSEPDLEDQRQNDPHQADEQQASSYPGPHPADGQQDHCEDQYRAGEHADLPGLEVTDDGHEEQHAARHEIRSLVRYVLGETANQRECHMIMTKLFAAGVMVVMAAGWLSAGQQENGQKVPTEALIDDLASTDNAKRTAATATLFGQGKAVLADLKKAGAKPVAPFGLSGKRLDMVYSILEGLPANVPGALSGYRTDSFGLHVERGTTAEDVDKLCQKYKLSVSGKFFPDASPNCYVTMQKGAVLEDVIRQILSREPKVVTITLNYFER
jgi:hypothetical protein